jgi:hypothetical protein
MEAYTKVTAMFNLSLPPTVPALVKSYEQRRALFGEQNPSWKHGRGRARRWKRELHVRDTMDWRRRLLGGELVMVGQLRLRRTWRELVHAPLARSTGALSATRAHARVEWLGGRPARAPRARRHEVDALRSPEGRREVLALVAAARPRACPRGAPPGRPPRVNGPSTPHACSTTTTGREAESHSALTP